LDAAWIVGGLTALYAMAGAAQLVLCWNAQALERSPGLTPFGRAVFALMPSYVAGFRGAALASAMALYGLAAALVFAKAADAIHLYAIALSMDLALFVSWRADQRSAYVALLAPALRWGEAALVLGLAGILALMLVLRNVGVLV
jgi:hypothetical protein